MSLNNCKIICISDLHGQLPKIKESFDLLLIAGDIVDLYAQRYLYPSKQWFTKIFIEWVNNLPFNDENSKVIFIFGNHEVFASEMPEFERIAFVSELSKLTNYRLCYLEDNMIITHGLKIYGSPWCRIFGNWGFMKNDEALKEAYSKIPENIDILLTHDAPYGTSDKCFEWIRYGKNPIHLGNEPLRDAILEKHPRISIHGHLHSSNHIVEMLDTTAVYNVSLLNEDYELFYDPLILNVDVLS